MSRLAYNIKKPLLSENGILAVGYPLVIKLLLLVQHSGKITFS